MSYTQARLSGLGVVYSVTGSPVATVQSLQQALARMGLLQGNTSSAGVDGKWGPITAAAVTAAAQRLGWTSYAFAPSNANQSGFRGEVTVPDALLSQIQAGVAAVTPTGVPVLHVPPGSPSPYPDGSGTPVPSDAYHEADGLLPGSSVGGGGPTWLPYAVVGGAVAVGAGILWFASRRKYPTTPVTANRRRRSRRRR